MSKYGFDELDEDFNEDDDLTDFEDDLDDFEDEEEEPEEDIIVDEHDEESESQIFVCEDCSYRWLVDAVEEVDLFDHYNDGIIGNVCPMCGSFSVYNDEE
jgi:hypothetical protein